MRHGVAAFFFFLVFGCGFFPSSAPSNSPPPCRANGVVSLSIKVLKPDGTFVYNPKGEWTTSDGRTGDCYPTQDQLVCGSDVAGDMTVNVSAEGFWPQKTSASIPQTECLVETQNQSITLEPQYYEKTRSYIYSMFSSQDECIAALAPGGFNCCARAYFQGFGRATIQFTRSSYTGTYVLKGKDIIFTKTSTEDGPDVMTFSEGADGLLTDDFKKWTWKPWTALTCFEETP